MKYTIKDLAEGRCAVINDGTREELRKVLKLAFPEDNYLTQVAYKYYQAGRKLNGCWCCNDSTKLPTQSVKDFLLHEEFVLPENWCVKVTQENKDVIHRWKLDNTEGSVFTCVGHYVTSKGTWQSEVSSDHIEITYKQFCKYVLKEKTNIDNRFPFTASGIIIKRLYDSIPSNCSWSARMFTLYGKAILDGTDCLVEESVYLDARKDANKAQHVLLDEIFGRDIPKSPYKEGELVLVHNHIKKEWMLRYTNGKLTLEGFLECYRYQEKYGYITEWSTHKPSGITLPE